MQGRSPQPTQARLAPNREKHPAYTHPAQAHSAQSTPSPSTPIPGGHGLLWPFYFGPFYFKPILLWPSSILAQFCCSPLYTAPLWHTILSRALARSDPRLTKWFLLWRRQHPETVKFCDCRRSALPNEGGQTSLRYLRDGNSLFTLFVKNVGHIYFMARPRQILTRTCDSVILQ